MNNDLISRTKLLAALGLENAVKYGNESAEQQHRSYSTWMSYEVRDEIDAAPAEDAEIVRHARWARIRNDYGHLYEGECTNCGCEPLHYPFHSPWRYCPNCGARMDAKEDA